jgi:hypothetical protein
MWIAAFYPAKFHIERSWAKIDPARAAMVLQANLADRNLRMPPA